MSVAAATRRNFVTPQGRPLSFTRLGFGGAPLGNMHRALPEVEAEATVQAAWDAGLRYFDTAPLYGHGLSEARIGRALAGAARGDFILSTKVGRLLAPCEAGRRGLRHLSRHAGAEGAIRLQRRRRAALARGEPRAAGAGPGRHPLRP